MLDTVRRYLGAITDIRVARAIRAVVDPLADRYSTQSLTSAGLVIKAGGSALAKTGAADFYACVAGVLVKIAAGTDMPALTGMSFGAGAFNVAQYFVDSAGTVTAAFGTAGATLGAVVFPQQPAKKALIGTLIVTYASPFVGGTTPLDTATTVFLSATGPFDPTVLVS